MGKRAGFRAGKSLPRAPGLDLPARRRETAGHAQGEALKTERPAAAREAGKLSGQVGQRVWASQATHGLPRPPQRLRGSPSDAARPNPAAQAAGLRDMGPLGKRLPVLGAVPADSSAGALGTSASGPRGPRKGECQALAPDLSQSLTPLPGLAWPRGVGAVWPRQSEAAQWGPRGRHGDPGQLTGRRVLCQP